MADLHRSRSSSDDRFREADRGCCWTTEAPLLLTEVDEGVEVGDVIHVNPSTLADGRLDEATEDRKLDKADGSMLPRLDRSASGSPLPGVTTWRYRDWRQDLSFFLLGGDSSKKTKDSEPSESATEVRRLEDSRDG